VSLNGNTKQCALKIANSLRRDGVSCEIDLLNRSMKSQMREANRLGADFVLIIGDEEMKSNSVTLKRMKDGTQEQIPLRTEEILRNLI